METVQQNGRFTLFSSKFLSIHSILYGTPPSFHAKHCVSNSFVKQSFVCNRPITKSPSNKFLKKMLPEYKLNQRKALILLIIINQ